MKAVVYNEYGSPGVLRIEDVEPPKLSEDRVLVRVRAASINAWDHDLLRGVPLSRIGGLRGPRHRILGGDVAGIVEEVGSAVDDFAVGDEVFGDIAWFGLGGFAELATAPAKALAPKPSAMSFEQAAAIPQAGVLALQGLRKHSALEAGSEVLVNGAGGGVGTFAVQLASSLGATVTAVDRAAKLERLRALGANDVIDFQTEDYTDGRGRYDLIIDPVGRRSVFANRRALSAQGRYVMIGGSIPRLLQVFALGPLFSTSNGKHLGVLQHKVSREDMVQLGEMVHADEVEPVIDSIFSLEDAPEAFQHFEAGDFVGKIVMTV